MLVKETKHKWVFVTIAMSVTFISNIPNEAIKNVYVKLYVNLSVMELRLRALTRNYWNYI